MTSSSDPFPAFAADSILAAANQPFWLRKLNTLYEEL